jgi:hypothetical protein
MRGPAAPSTGFLFNTDVSGLDDWTIIGFSGTGNVALVTSPIFVTPNLGTPSVLVLTNATGLTASQIPAVNFATPGASHTFTGTSDFFECTTTCTITVPVPSAGVQYCVRNANNVATVITLSAIGSSVFYEKTNFTAYGTAGTGTNVSGGAAGDKMCIIGKDATHYDVASYNGTWTAN